MNLFLGNREKYDSGSAVRICAQIQTFAAFGENSLPEFANAESFLPARASNHFRCGN
jgi:hypothetical protein